MGSDIAHDFYCLLEGHRVNKSHHKQRLTILRNPIAERATGVGCVAKTSEW
jgi:hypothetical protein